MALTATMRLVDDVSNKFQSMATAGSAAFDRINSSIAAASAQTAQYDAAAVDAGRATLQWTEKLGNYNEDAMRAIYTTEELIEEGYAVAVAIDDAGEAADGTGDALDEMGEQASDAGDQMDEAAEQAEEFGDKSSEAIGELDSLLASAGIIAGLKAIYDGFMEAAKGAEELETAQAKLATIAGTENMAALTPQINDLSNASGIAATELNDVAYNAISAGSAVEDSVNMAKTASELAVAGFTNSGAALSVLSTAMNSYGDQIESVTDVADSLITVQNLGVTTVDQLASQMGKSIATAAAYGVSLGNVESAYISVTKAGINTAEGTTYISGMLNELGKSSSDIAKIIQEETGKSFGQLMNDGASLADVLGIVYNTVNQDSEAMINLFGSQEAGKAAMAIINQGLDQFNENLNAVTNSAGATASAYAIMADTTEFSHQKMQNSMQNLANTAGGVLNIGLKRGYDAITNITNAANDFVKKHPNVIRALTAGATAVGVLALAVTGYTAVTKLAAAASAIFTAALNANPIFLAVTAIAALTAGIAVFIATIEDAETEYSQFSAQTIQMQNDIDETSAALEAAKDKYGENSAEAALLKDKLAQLQTQYDANSQTLEEHQQAVQATIDNYDELLNQHKNTLNEVDSEAATVDNLVAKLKTLADGSSVSAAEQEQILSIVRILNNALPDLGLQYDKTTNSINMSTEALENATKAQKDLDSLHTLRDELDNLQVEYDQLGQSIADQQKATDAAKENLDKLTNTEQWKNYKDSVDAVQKSIDGAINQNDQKQAAYYQQQMAALILTNSDLVNSVEDAQAAYDAEKDALDSLTSQQADYETQIQSTNDRIAEIQDTFADTGDAATDAFNTAVEAVSADVQVLIAAYNEAYNAAYESIDGQIGLFDSMKTESSLTTSEMLTNLQSQIDYLDTYAANLKAAAELGFSEELIASLSDGSAESAGYLDAIVTKATELGGKGSEAGDEFVNGFNEKMAGVETAKENWATQVAKMKTDFDNEMDNIKARMDQAVNDMNKDTEAAAAATATVNAYIANIRAGVQGATNAAQAVANAAAAALNSAPTTPGHAAGSTNTEDAFIAGEQGPELYVGYGGGTVFPHSETEQVINAVKDYADIPEPPDEVSSMSIQSLPVQSESGESSERKITLDINGGGSIKMDGNVDKEQVLDIMVQNIRPVLLDLLEEEISEEGDGTYEY